MLIWFIQKSKRDFLKVKIWVVSERGIWDTSLHCSRRTRLSPNQLRLTSSSPLQIFTSLISWGHPSLENTTFQRVYWPALLSLGSPKWGYITVPENTTITITRLCFKSRMTQGPTEQSLQAWDSWPLVLLGWVWLYCWWVCWLIPHCCWKQSWSPNLRGQDSYTDIQEVIATSFLDFLIVSCKHKVPNVVKYDAICLPKR